MHVHTAVLHNSHDQDLNFVVCDLLFKEKQKMAFPLPVCQPFGCAASCIDDTCFFSLSFPACQSWKCLVSAIPSSLKIITPAYKIVETQAEMILNEA